MPKIKWLRCKTPHDILVITSRKDLDHIVNVLRSDRWVTCGHDHPIVCGDIHFRLENWVNKKWSKKK